MQTKPKQKLTAILIAFTMILTTMMQLCIPLTVHADVLSKYGFTISSYCDGSLLAKNIASSSSPIVNIRITYNDSDGYQRVRYLAVIKNPTTSTTITRSPHYYQDGEEIPQGDEVYNISNGNLVTVNSDTYLWVRIQDYANESKNGHTFSNQCTSSYYNYETNELGDSPELDAITAYANGSLKEETEKTFDDIATYDDTIPTPKFKVEKNLRFDFLNSESDYYYEVKGRWYTTDDFYLHLGGFMNAIWLYDYETIYKNELTEWITYQDKKNTAITGYLTDIGKDSFNDLITKYPIGTRQITGEKNKDGSYKAGFEHASSNLVMWLKDATSIYNGIEVYIRYYKIDENGNYTYGKWAHYYNSLAKQSGAEINDNVLNDVEHNYSDKGLTNDELNDLENSGQSKGDTDIITDYGDNGGGILSEIDKLDEVDFSNVVKVILSLFQQTKAVFNMFTTVLSFMPIWVTELIGVSVAIICLIGIWKALR